MVLPPRFTTVYEQPSPPRLSKHNYTSSLLRGVLYEQQHKATLPPPPRQARVPIQTSDYTSHRNPKRENQQHHRGASSSTSGSGSASSSTTTAITACSRTSSTLTLENDEVKKIFSPSPSSAAEPPTKWTITDIPPQIKANELRRSTTLSQDLLAGINWNPSDPTKRSIWSTQLRPLIHAPAWYRTFHYGVRAPTPASLNQYAVSLVEQGHDTTWDEESVSELARFFVYRAAQRAGCMGEVDSLAAFAERVYRTFEGMPWEGLHTIFARSLGESLLRTFVACWHVDADNKGAITIQKCPTAQYGAYVSSALALSNFIGELYNHGLLPRTQTIGCVRVLLKNVKSIEHVQAMHAIILHAGIRLWQGSEEVKEFIKFLFGCTVGVKDNASVMGKAYPPKELERWVTEVARLVRGFHTSLKDN